MNIVELLLSVLSDCLRCCRVVLFVAVSSMSNTIVEWGSKTKGSLQKDEYFGDYIAKEKSDNMKLIPKSPMTTVR